MLRLFNKYKELLFKTIFFFLTVSKLKFRKTKNYVVFSRLSELCVFVGGLTLPHDSLFRLLWHITLLSCTVLRLACSAVCADLVVSVLH